MTLTTPPTAATSPPTAERGAGLIGVSAGVAAFLLLLAFAVQLLFNLYATSSVTAAAYDAARMVAADGGDPATVPDAEAHAREVLGRYAERVRFDWERSDDTTVRLHVAADNHNPLFSGLGLTALQRVDRTVEVRVECFREKDACR